eukprot:g25998.t1
MTGCEQAQQWWRAFVLYEKMQHLGIQADATTHGTLLSAMERANHWQHAAYALCTGVFSNRALLNGVLNASSSSGQWELTLQLLHSGHETDMLSFGTTALALAKGRLLENGCHHLSTVFAQKNSYSHRRTPLATYRGSSGRTRLSAKVQKDSDAQDFAARIGRRQDSHSLRLFPHCQ